MSAARLFLVWHGAADAEVALGDEMHPLRPGMFLVRSDRTRSEIYHAVKRQLPADTALLAAPLADAPKFKGMQDGALKWLRMGA